MIWVLCLLIQGLGVTEEAVFFLGLPKSAISYSGELPEKKSTSLKATTWRNVLEIQSPKTSLNKINSSRPQTKDCP